MADVLQRPVLTLPPAEAEVVADAYGAADVILEYGSGGSTALAHELGKTVFSVESDADWLAGMARWFAGKPGADRVRLHHADIGPTGDWGKPRDLRGYRRFPGYALSVWERADFQPPDVVLIDGRFRPSCLLATAFLTRRPVRVLFDDYIDRARYHAVEELFPRHALHGRMAEFHIEPTAIPADRLNWIIGWFLQPQ